MKRTTHEDHLGFRPERHRVFQGALLSRKLDRELQAIVEETARTLNAPIALVSLVLDSIQLFRAHTGLPHDLVTAQATHRDASFCQLVVRDNEPLVVEDATTDERVPTALTKSHGIRAYAGVPIVLDGVTVGTLCAIDLEARAFSDADLESLATLAARAKERLDELRHAGLPGAPTVVEAHMLGPVFADAKNALFPLLTGLTDVRTALAEVTAFQRGALDTAPDGSNDDVDDDDETLTADAQLVRTAVALLDDIELAGRRLAANVDVLEDFLVRRDHGSRLEDICVSAIELAMPAMRHVGKTTLAISAGEHRVNLPRNSAVTAIAVPLVALAAAALDARLHGDLAIEGHSADDDIVVVIRADERMCAAITAARSELERMEQVTDAVFTDTTVTLSLPCKR